MTADNNLKPCPFCGADAEVMNYFKDAAVECSKNCTHRLTVSGINKAEAIKKWNTRAGSNKPVEVTIEQFEEKIRQQEKDDWIGQWYGYVVYGAIRRFYPDGVKIVERSK